MCAAAGVWRAPHTLCRSVIFCAAESPPELCPPKFKQQTTPTLRRQGRERSHTARAPAPPRHRATAAAGHRHAAAGAAHVEGSDAQSAHRETREREREQAHTRVTRLLIFHSHTQRTGLFVCETWHVRVSTRVLILERIHAARGKRYCLLPPYCT